MNEIPASFLRRLGWKEARLEQGFKSDPVKLAIAARLRRETTLPLKWIAGRLHLGSWKSLNAKLHRSVKSHSNTRK
jgi:hypothetical protein